MDKIDLNRSKETKRYVMVITERTCIDILRKHRRQAEVSLEGLQTERNLNTDVDGMEKVYQTEVLRQMLEKMSELTRQIFLLKYGKWICNAEIASITYYRNDCRQRISREKKKNGEVSEKGKGSY